MSPSNAPASGSTRRGVRIDREDRRLNERHAGLDEVAVGVAHRRRCAAPEHYVQL
jgi:hypothetical protein